MLIRLLSQSIGVVGSAWLALVAQVHKRTSY
jgi:hypothetical protein